MPSIRYDDRSFILDDRRVWLSSGAIHYFRVPRELWRDRLLKAKRAGLNCIESYVPWNLHEPQEGKWDFSGDNDLVAFITLAKELGLYFILRPGPYICSEWDFGGFPAWLATKSGIAYRTSNATFMHYFDKYLAQVLPRLADLQYTRGGNIILIANENEYYYTTTPDRLNYLGFISQLIRRAGFDIPIITCNWLTEPKVPDTIECYNGFAGHIQSLKRLRTMQPDAPMLASEFWTGWFDYWGGAHSRRDPADVARRALEMLGCGTQVNYYMFSGGTNFGFWGSRLNVTDASYQTTSYDCDAPVAEGGGLTKKYYLTKLVNMLATHFAQVFAQARMEGPGVTVHDGTQVFNVVGPAGRIAVISNNGNAAVTSAQVSLSDGLDLHVALEPLGAAAILMRVPLGSDRLLDYANLMPLGVFGEGNMVLHGPAGWEGRVSINGKELRQVVPAGDDVVVVEHKGQRIIFINTELAQRAWDVDGSLLLGPAFVGEDLEQSVAPAGVSQYTLIAPDGKVSKKKAKPVAKAPAAPALGRFERLAISEETMNKDLPWARLERPADMAALGVERGYAWYRLDVQSEAAGKRELFLPDCEDRATIYANGERVGVWGRGPDAVRTPIRVPLARGANTLLFLVDNLGRPNFGAHLGQHKGIFGPVWEAQELDVKKFKLTDGGDFSRRMVPRMYAHMLERLEQGPLSTAEVTFALPKISPVHLSFTGLAHDCIVLCNGRLAGFFPADGGGYGDVTLGNELSRGKNTVTLLLWGKVDPACLDNVKLHLLTDNFSAGGSWSCRKLEIPQAKGRSVGKGLPVWYSCRFKSQPTDIPLFLHLTGVKKGQIYLNGHNIGRFWNIGPQEQYYLPAPWLAAENELLIFEEQGNIPTTSSLSYRPGGPYQELPKK